MLTTPTTLEKLEAGWRYCVSCAKLCIHPLAKSWNVRCSACFADEISSRYCTHCGEFIDDSRRNFARDRGGEAKTCYPCGRLGLAGRKALMKTLAEKVQL